jgi:hypothetical protein
LPQSGLPDTEEYTPGFVQNENKGLNTEGALSGGIDWNAPAAQRKGSGRGLQKNPAVPTPGRQQQAGDGTARLQGNQSSRPASHTAIKKPPQNLTVDESGIVWGTAPNGQPQRVAMPPKRYGLTGGSQFTTSLYDGAAGRKYTLLSDGALEYLSVLARNGLQVPPRIADEIRKVDAPKDVKALRQIFGPSF